MTDLQEEPLFEEVSAMEQAMISEEKEKDGTFLTGGAMRDHVELEEEHVLDPELVLNPRPVKDGAALLDFLRKNLHQFDSPYAYLGGEANCPDRDRFHDAEVRVLITRLSTYEATSLSLAHSLLAQIAQEMPRVFVDLAFLPKPNDYRLLKENNFPVWFGANTKLAPDKFDLIAISHPLNMEQMNFIPLLHDSGVPIFKDQRMERPDIPLVIMGGMNSRTCAPLCGSWTDPEGKTHSHLIDAVIIGDGEITLKQAIATTAFAKRTGLDKRACLRAMHGKIHGFYEPDCYTHEEDGHGRITKIRHTEGREYAELPVRSAVVPKLDLVRGLESKILPFTGDGTSVDYGIAGSRGCIGGPGGNCSFCREGNEGPYRERSLNVIMKGLERATKNQGTKEVTYFSLNFNQHTEFFPLVYESVKRGYSVGLISQRIDMLAETPEQVKVQRWLSKSNFSLGVEGISERLRNFLTKNTTEAQILTTMKLMMEENAGEIKLYYIICGIEDEGDVNEYCAFMDKVEALKKEGHHTTSIRISFTPLFPSASTPLQFYPVFAASKPGSKSLNPIFTKARDLGWGRRLSISGEEPLVSNLIALGGRCLLPILMAAHFKDNFRFYGHIPRGTWARWKKRIDADPNIDTDIIWGEKPADYIFPWDDTLMGMPKETLYEEYKKCLAFKGSGGYCLTTRLKKGKCLWKRCGLCSLGTDDRKPNQEVVQAIINRKVAPVIPLRVIEEAAKSREKSYHLRLRMRTTDPIYRFVGKNYWLNAIPRALMLASPRFNDAFIKPLGHARSGAGAAKALDWTFGENYYDFALSDHIPESELRALIPAANQNLPQGEILDLRLDKDLTTIRNDVDFCIYTTLIPNSGIAYGRLRNSFERHFERRYLGREAKIKVKKTQGKGVYVTVEKDLAGEDVRQLTYQWLPDRRGTLVRFVCAAKHNPLALLEALTELRAHSFKAFPIYVDGYVQAPEETGETDIFAALAGQAQRCSKTGLPLERDLFTGEAMKSGISLAAEDGLDVNFPVHLDWFATREMQAIELQQAAE